MRWLRPGTPSRPIAKYERLIARAKAVPPPRTLVVHPCDESSLRGALEAAEAGIIIPVLVGPSSKITAVAREHKLDIGSIEIVDAPHSDAAAALAVRMIHEAKGELLMKGSLHTDELMRAVTASATGLRTARRISHVFVMDVPTYTETLFITDAAINIFPDLDAKRDIVQNAIDLYTEVGLGTPRVAILSAVETVTAKIPSTIDAAALCKMADRGQITGGLLDGPLAFDNAIDPEAARIKGLGGPVAGPRADPRGARSRSRQHARQEPHIPDQGRRRRDRPRRTRTGDPHIARRFRARAPRLVRCRRALRRCPPACLEPPCGVIGMCAILVVNAGSSSVKFQVFSTGDAANLRAPRQGPGRRHRHAAAASRRSGGRRGPGRRELFPGSCSRSRRGDCVGREMAWRARSNSILTAVGHRVVHGGFEFDRPVLVTMEILDRLERYVPLAPLHQPNNLAPIRSLLANRPDLPQVACFDTAFHRGHDAVVDHYAIPERFYAEGVRRYGFHGLSYEFVANQLRYIAPDIAGGRVIVAHLGSGASMCALSGGRSVESTLGFTALDGLPMGTRPGQIDPGVLLYLLNREGNDARRDPGLSLS